MKHWDGCTRLTGPQSTSTTRVRALTPRGKGNAVTYKLRLKTGGEPGCRCGYDWKSPHRHKYALRSHKRTFEFSNVSHLASTPTDQLRFTGPFPDPLLSHNSKFYLYLRLQASSSRGITEVHTPPTSGDTLPLYDDRELEEDVGHVDSRQCGVCGARVDTEPHADECNILGALL